MFETDAAPRPTPGPGGAVVVTDAPGQRPGPGDGHRTGHGVATARRSRAMVAWRVAAGGALALGVLLRFWCSSDLWLDEALSVNIARLPLSELPEALRHDGAPPLYYVLLHGWMRLFGEGDFAVRALSGVFATATLPLIWLVGRRVGRGATAWAAVLLLASSPFAVRYATETRMYALVLFLTLVGHLALARALERPTVGRLAAVAAIAALLLYTHYWSLYLLATVGAWLVVQARRSGPARRCLVALAAGGLAFLPWLPTFLFQARHTGTPWARSPAAGLLPDTIGNFAGNRTDAGSFLEVLIVALLVLALFGRPIGGRRIELTPRVRPSARPLAAVVGVTLLVGWSAGIPSGSAFTARYTTVVLGSFLVLVALGVRNVPDRRLRRWVLGAAVVLGLLASSVNIGQLRTQGTAVARAVRRQGNPGDVVAYCPDHLGPATHRLLPAGFQEVTFPAGTVPERIDWVDYRERVEETNPWRFAHQLVEQAGPSGSIFLVWSPGRFETGARCEQLLGALGQLRRADPVFFLRSRYQERMALTRFDP